MAALDRLMSYFSFEVADAKLTIEFNDFVWMLRIYMFFVGGFALRPSNYLQSPE